MRNYTFSKNKSQFCEKKKTKEKERLENALKKGGHSMV